jgi:hypothetical protein
VLEKVVVPEMVKVPYVSFGIKVVNVVVPDVRLVVVEVVVVSVCVVQLIATN